MKQTLEAVGFQIKQLARTRDSSKNKINRVRINVKTIQYMLTYTLHLFESSGPKSAEFYFQHLVCRNTQAFIEN